MHDAILRSTHEKTAAVDIADAMSGELQARSCTSPDPHPLRPPKSMVRYRSSTVVCRKTLAAIAQAAEVSVGQVPLAEVPPGQVLVQAGQVHAAPKAEASAALVPGELTAPLPEKTAPIVSIEALVPGEATASVGEAPAPLSEALAGQTAAGEASAGEATAGETAAGETAACEAGEVEAHDGWREWAPDLADYAEDVFRNRKAEEARGCVPADYMTRQTNINVKMRAILIDWLWVVWNRFSMAPETMFLAVQLTDRYLAQHKCLRMKLQLVGTTAMFVAAKVEEIYFPEIRDFVYITDRAYERPEFVQMERTLIRALDYSFTVPTAYSFLKHYSQHVEPGCVRTCIAAVYAYAPASVAMETVAQLPSEVAFGCVLFALMNRHRLKTSVLRRHLDSPDRQSNLDCPVLVGQELEQRIQILERCAQLHRSVAVKFFTCVRTYVEGTLKGVDSGMFPDAATLSHQQKLLQAHSVI
jgi:hypothetical protein